MPSSDSRISPRFLGWQWQGECGEWLFIGIAFSFLFMSLLIASLYLLCLAFLLGSAVYVYSHDPFAKVNAAFAVLALSLMAWVGTLFVYTVQTEGSGLFRRDAPDHPLTPTKISLLLWIAELGILTVPQLAGLTSISPGSVRRHLRDLFDLGLVDRIGVPPSSLALPDAPNVPALLYGRAPTLYAVSPDGWKALVETGRMGKGDVRPAPNYGPKNALFLAHEVQVRDVRVWLERCRRHHDHEGVTLWKTDARLGRARPDAVFVYKANGATLVGMVEVDRGTEKSPARWQEKFQDYAGVWDTGEGGCSWSPPTRSGATLLPRRLGSVCGCVLSQQSGFG